MFRAYENPSQLGNWEVAHTLAAQPDRAELVAASPDMTVREARKIVRDRKPPAPTVDQKPTNIPDPNADGPAEAVMVTTPGDDEIPALTSGEQFKTCRKNEYAILIDAMTDSIDVLTEQSWPCPRRTQAQIRELWAQIESLMEKDSKCRSSHVRAA